MGTPLPSVPSPLLDMWPWGWHQDGHTNGVYKCPASPFHPWTCGLRGGTGMGALMGSNERTFGPLSAQCPLSITEEAVLRMAPRWAHRWGPPLPSIPSPSLGTPSPGLMGAPRVGLLGAPRGWVDGRPPGWVDGRPPGLMGAPRPRSALTPRSPRSHALHPGAVWHSHQRSLRALPERTAEPGGRPIPHGSARRRPHGRPGSAQLQHLHGELRRGVGRLPLPAAGRRAARRLRCWIIFRKIIC